MSHKHRQTPTMFDAFEFYYSLGDKRNLRSVAAEFKTTPRTAQNWSIWFNWQEQIHLREMENRKVMIAETNTKIIAEKSSYRNVIKSVVSIYIQDLNEMLSEKDPKKKATLKEKLPKIVNVRDLETLLKMDLLLMGEPTEITEQNGTIKDNAPKKEVGVNVEKLLNEYAGFFGVVAKSAIKKAAGAKTNQD